MSIGYVDLFSTIFARRAAVAFAALSFAAATLAGDVDLPPNLPSFTAAVFLLMRLG